MSTYIVMDLEWNQSPNGKEYSVEGFPFEIIEIGAVKLDEQLRIAAEYHQLIAPQVYKHLHYRISQVTHLNMKDLQRVGRPFPIVVKEFLEWCGEDYRFCTWGSMDVTELQRNMAYYGLENPFPFPLLYYDIQKLYAFQVGANKEKPALDHAIVELGIPKERPFHRALDDAYYTGMVMRSMGFEKWKPYVSVDYFRMPSNEKEEIFLEFPTYSKYVSRIFPSRDAALADKRVTDMICGKCRRMLRKKIQWFSLNQKQYFCLAVCPEHGYIRGKLRMKKADGESVYVIKKLKPADENGVQKIIEKKEEQRKRRKERMHNKKN